MTATTHGGVTSSVFEADFVAGLATIFEERISFNRLSGCASMRSRPTT